MGKKFLGLSSKMWVLAVVIVAILLIALLMYSNSGINVAGQAELWPD